MSIQYWQYSTNNKNFDSSPCRLKGLMYISFQPEPGEVMVMIASQKKKLCVVNCKKNQVRWIRYGNYVISAALCFLSQLLFSNFCYPHVRRAGSLKWNILHKLFTSLNSKVFKKREDSEPLDTLSNLTEPILEEIPTSDWSENIWICNIRFP